MTVLGFSKTKRWLQRLTPFTSLVYLLLALGCSNKHDNRLKSLYSHDRIIFINFNNSNNTVIDSRVEVLNRGLKPVKLSKVIADCSCIDIQFDKSPIYPKKKRVIQFKIGKSVAAEYSHSELYVITEEGQNIKFIIISNS